ncbi:MAG: hypothetical protein OIN66_02115 [Candidatus Methanoperedens sp.]|nr:hypothetical protein [Candidatus Methanoperedens sp.]
MDAKDNTLYPLIILFFLLGLVVGYVIHKPVTEERIQIVNQTVKETPIIKEVEKIVYVTVTPTSTVSAVVTSVSGDFSVKIYDPATDRPSNTMELTNWRFSPDTLSIRSGETVLIKITDLSLQNPLILTIDPSDPQYKRDLGRSGAVVVTFNKKGTYNLKAVTISSDPNIQPTTYGQGTVTIY